MRGVIFSFISHSRPLLSLSFSLSHTLSLLYSSRTHNIISLSIFKYIYSNTLYIESFIILLLCFIVSHFYNARGVRYFSIIKGGWGKDSNRKDVNSLIDDKEYLS